jgi:hypothetical protein
MSATLLIIFLSPRIATSIYIHILFIVIHCDVLRNSSVHCLYLFLFTWIIIIITIITAIVRRHSFYHQRCLLRYVAVIWWIRRIITPTSINGNILRNMQYFPHTLTTTRRTTKRWHNPAHNFKIHSFPARVSNYRKSINKILYSPIHTEGRVELINRVYSISSYKGERIIQRKSQFERIYEMKYSKHS